MAYTPGVSHINISPADPTGPAVKSFLIENGTIGQARLEIITG